MNARGRGRAVAGSESSVTPAGIETPSNAFSVEYYPGATRS